MGTWFCVDFHFPVAILSLLLGFFFKIYFLLYVHWCFVCMYVYVRVLDALELELQTVV